MHKLRKRHLVVIALVMAVGSARAEIVSSSDTHFKLRHEAESAYTVKQMWQRLINVESWWHPEHTYSGQSSNLSLDPKAGGLWLETWDQNSVSHGRVLYLHKHKTLRLEAPFGPLQALGAYTIWTITIEATESGSRVIFDEVSTAPAESAMQDMANAVDFVKNEAINRLVSKTLAN